MVRLPETGAVLLSGNAVHLKDNWDDKRVPPTNVAGGTLSASMQRMSQLIAKNKAQLWVNHDKPQSETNSAAHLPPCRHLPTGVTDPRPLATPSKS